jgi:hypothetical protein
MARTERPRFTRGPNDAPAGSGPGFNVSAEHIFDFDLSEENQVTDDDGSGFKSGAVELLVEESHARTTFHPGKAISASEGDRAPIWRPARLAERGDHLLLE